MAQEVAKNVAHTISELQSTMEKRIDASRDSLKETMLQQATERMALQIVHSISDLERVMEKRLGALERKLDQRKLSSSSSRPASDRSGKPASHLRPRQLFRRHSSLGSGGLDARRVSLRDAEPLQEEDLRNAWQEEMLGITVSADLPTLDPTTGELSGELTLTLEGCNEHGGLGLGLDRNNLVSDVEPRSVRLAPQQ